MSESTPNDFELPVGAKMKRPRLNIPRTQLEIYCELLGAAVVISTIVYLGVLWSSLPATIPVHFMADHSSGEGKIPGSGILVYVGFSDLSFRNPRTLYLSSLQGQVIIPNGTFVITDFVDIKN